MKAKVMMRKTSYKETEKVLDRSCDQMTTILQKISKIERRYKLAIKNRKTLTADSLSMQLQVLRGVYNMYYCYAEVKAKQLVTQSQQLVSDLDVTTTTQLEDFM